MNCKSERGAVMLEATWCVVLVMFVFLFLISLGFLLYQQSLVHIVANEAAAELSQTYKYRNAADSSTVKVSDVKTVGIYRYLLNGKKFLRSNEQKLESIAESRLALTSLAEERGDLSVIVERIPDDLGRYHLKIKVSQRYGFLLGDFLTLIGLDEYHTLSSTVYVAGTDILFYMNSIQTTACVAGLMDGYLGGTIDSLVSTIKNMISVFS